MGSRNRPGKEAKKKPKAKAGPTKPFPAFGTAAERRADPQAAQGEAGRRGRHRRGLTGRVRHRGALR